MWPIICELGDLTLYSYGTAMLVGAALGGYLAWRLCPPRLFELTHFLTICILTTVGASVGARVFQAVSVPWAGQSGLSSMGVPLVVGPLVLGYCVWARLRWRAVFDHLLPFAVFGAAFQRIFGCFMGGCCRGKASDHAWAVMFPGSNTAVHPTQLYLGSGLFVVFVFLVRWRSTIPGQKALVALGLYGLLGFLISPLRTGLGEPWLLGLTVYMWLHGALALMGLGGAWLMGYTSDRFESSNFKERVGA